MGKKQTIKLMTEQKFSNLWQIKNRPVGFSVPSNPSPRQLFMCVQCKKSNLTSLMFMFCSKCEDESSRSGRALVA